MDRFPSKENQKLYSRVYPLTPEDEIVISGISGRFPNSKNISDFGDNLYNKVDMVDDDEKRWRHTNPEIPKRMGKLHNLEKFDATFFGVHFKQAHTMDPQVISLKIYKNLIKILMSYKFPSKSVVFF
jgi:fatty acid synthase, animal type